MGSGRAIRMFGAFAIAGAGLLVAGLLGAPFAGALLALLAGAAAFALAPSSRRESSLAVPAPGQDPVDDQSGVAELLRAVDEPMLVIRDRRVLAANAAARDLLGAHIEGTDVRLALRHPAAAELLAGPHSEELVETRIDLVGLGGPERQWTMTVAGLPDKGRLVRLADLSQVRAAEQMRADFVANASHELRTPLATLLGFLETLQDEETAADAATRARFLGIMFDEATRMRALVDDLMSLSRI
ncbi:MAG: histidine kinase dimerization/phospho-acceptor domain-containing protein, partial [Allosphingosinicella sp.]